MREEGQQAQHGNDLELDLVGLVRHALGQGMQAEKQEADRQHGEDQNTAITTMTTSVRRGSNERRQIMGGSG